MPLIKEFCTKQSKGVKPGGSSQYAKYTALRSSKAAETGGAKEKKSHVRYAIGANGREDEETAR